MNSDTKHYTLNKQSVREKIASIINSSHHHPHDSLATALWAASFFYSLGIRVWHSSYESGLRAKKKLSRPVISIGNLTVGGTGKTPFTVFLAEQLLKQGLQPAVLSRGYKGKKGTGPIVVSDGHTLFTDAFRAGDEPVLMAGRLSEIPVIVGADRIASNGTCV